MTAGKADPPRAGPGRIFRTGDRLMGIPETVRDHGPPDGFASGDAPYGLAWNRLHDHPETGDADDVAFFDPESPEQGKEIEQSLRSHRQEGSGRR